MTEKEIKKLGRHDLLMLLAEQTARANQLEERLQQAEKQLDDRSVAIGECGTLAEAALRMSDVFHAADQAAAKYLEDIQLLRDKQAEECKKIEADSRAHCDELIHTAEERTSLLNQQANAVLQEAEAKAVHLVQEAEAKAAQIIQEAEEKASVTKQDAENYTAAELAKIDALWNTIYDKIHKMEKEYSWLRGMLQESIGDK